MHCIEKEVLYYKGRNEEHRPNRVTAVHMERAEVPRFLLRW